MVAGGASAVVVGAGASVVGAAVVGTGAGAGGILSRKRGPSADAEPSTQAIMMAIERRMFLFFCCSVKKTEEIFL